MELIDTHCHIDVGAFDADREEVLEAARAVGVAEMVVPAIHRQGWEGLLECCGAHQGLHPALGLHPVYLGMHEPDDLVALDHRLALEEGLVAVGEIGLDFFLRDLDRQRQMELCEAQLALARDHGLPVLLHVRKGHEEMLGLLKRTGVGGGIVHAFNGSLQQAGRYLDLGFRLGFGGMLTWPRSTRLRRLAAELPLEAIVLETDAPDLTVVQHRGERNSPAFLPFCLAALAEVRRMEMEEVAEATTRSARQVLRLGDSP
ncbi:MAG TPA: TatD family deoxyribonuclease [Thiotrichales bacterium]|nr:TatD family deoxyribonuclease [Thiotrichales bacterium]